MDSARQLGAQVTYEDVKNAADFLRSHLTGECEPRIGIICGSGLGGLADKIEQAQCVSFRDIPHFATSTVPGHKGQLVFGWLHGHYVMCMQGRLHGYEGYKLDMVTFPIRVMAMLGVKVLIVTNACGGVNPEYKIGDIMVIKDHINLPGMVGLNPLVGPNDNRLGPRFLPTSDAYDQTLRNMARSISMSTNIDGFHEGVYIYNAGPCFESIAESRMFRMLGADVAGMSTVPEVVIARHCGMRCFAVSLITNMCVMDYDSEEKAVHDQVLTNGKQYGYQVETLVHEMIAGLDLHDSDDINENE